MYLPNEVEKQFKDTSHERLDNRVELDCDVNDVLQALGASLVQPGVHLSPLFIICEGADVRCLKGQQHILMRDDTANEEASSSVATADDTHSSCQANTSVVRGKDSAVSHDVQPRRITG